MHNLDDLEGVPWTAEEIRAMDEAMAKAVEQFLAFLALLGGTIASYTLAAMVGVGTALRASVAIAIWVITLGQIDLVSFPNKAEFDPFRTVGLVLGAGLITAWVAGYHQIVCVYLVWLALIVVIEPIDNAMIWLLGQWRNHFRARIVEM